MKLSTRLHSKYNIELAEVRTQAVSSAMFDQNCGSSWSNSKWIETEATNVQKKSLQAAETSLHKHIKLR